MVQRKVHSAAMAICLLGLVVREAYALSSASARALSFLPNDVDNMLEINRSDYRESLEGFWLGQSIANWTGLITEMDRVSAPFYTDADWGQQDHKNMWGNMVPHADRIDFVTTPAEGVWGADDDTDIEYLYQHLLEQSGGSLLTPELIRSGWLKHIYSNEDAPEGENYLWVSNERAYYLMRDGALPPQTSEPTSNPDSSMIDAQLTTEIFGLFAPGRVDVALAMAELPIRTSAYGEAAQIARFYVTLHALAAVVDRDRTPREKVLWLAEQGRQQLADDDFPALMYDFVLDSYRSNSDKDNWEHTRDAVYQRYQLNSSDGYEYQRPFDAGINFAASLVSLFYGEGDLKRTVRIGTLMGWDSDNPTATWGGLLGFMLGKKGVEAQFGETEFSDRYWIHRTRRNFPDRTPGQAGEDTFALMAQRGVALIDQIVRAQMGGRVDLLSDTWFIPRAAESQ